MGFLFCPGDSLSVYKRQGTLRNSYKRERDPDNSVMAPDVEGTATSESSHTYRDGRQHQKQLIYVSNVLTSRYNPKLHRRRRRRNKGEEITNIPQPVLYSKFLSPSNFQTVNIPRDRYLSGCPWKPNRPTYIYDWAEVQKNTVVFGKRDSFAFCRQRLSNPLVVYANFFVGRVWASCSVNTRVIAVFLRTNPAAAFEGMSVSPRGKHACLNHVGVSSQTWWQNASNSSERYI